MPMDRSILFFAATTTAVMCSHALPAMGMMMIPMKVRLRCVVLLTSSIAPVKNLTGQEQGGRGGGLGGHARRQGWPR